jgi:PAS domain S-box-containing protein
MISIKRSVFYSLIIIISISILSISILWFIDKNNDQIKKVKSLSTKEQIHQKQYLKKEVEQTIQKIELLLNFQSGENQDSLKNKFLDIIAKERLKYNGYFFINTIKGEALIFDGQRVQQHKDISELTDPNGLRLFDIQKEAYYLTDGKYINYLFKRIDNNLPEPKISFVKGYHNWGWIIGAGIYKNEPTLKISEIEKQYNRSFKKELLWIIIITLLLITISYFIVRHIDYRLNWQIGIINNFLKNAAKTGYLIQTQEIQFEELKYIADSINKMITEKENLTKKILEKDQNIKSIFKAADNIAFTITNLDGEKSKVLEFSPGAEKIFGYKQEDIINKKISVIHRPEDMPNYIKMQELIRDGLLGFNEETILIRKNKEHFAALYNIHPLFRGKEVIGIIGVTVDISKRKKMETELKNLKNNLEKTVIERTQEIITKNNELIEINNNLEHYNNLFIGREFRINELKIKIKDLEQADSRKK